jgi:hypothetical protein
VSDKEIKRDLYPSVIELPTYLKILSDFVLLGFLIPVCCWLFFVFYYKYLPLTEYKNLLSFIWFAVMLQIPPVIGITLLLIWILKELDTPVQDPMGQSLITNVKDLYAIFSHATLLNRILILPVFFAKLSLPFFLGWGVLGGFISMIAVAINK